MKNSVMALVASAAIALAPVSSALANTVAAQPADAIASAWVPATPAEQQAARGGSYSQFSPLISALTTICYNFNISIRTNSNYKSSYYCRGGMEPS